MAGEHLLSDLSHLRVMLIGAARAGKTATMNTILKTSEEEVHTDKCQIREAKIGSQYVRIVDTPGLCRAGDKKKEVLKEIKQSFQSAVDPHVFVIVLRPGPFTTQEKGMVETFRNTFGEEAIKRCMILFTHGNDIMDVEQYIQKSPDLMNLASKCQGGAYKIDNKAQDPSQVSDLLDKINKLVHKNKGVCYTEDMMDKVEKEKRKFIIIIVPILALVLGAAIGAAITYFVNSSWILLGAVLGAVVLFLIAIAGLIAFYRIKKRFEMKKPIQNP